MAGGAPFQQQKQQENKARGILHQDVYKTYENQSFSQEWRNLPEVPSKAEICPPKSLVARADADVEQDKSFLDYQNEPSYDQNLPHNIVDGPWPSKEAYLGAHYQILREDAIAPLRRAVAEFKKCSSLVDDMEICVYKDVTIKGLVLSKIGVGFRVEFSPQKQIKWKQSKRLLQGAMVALSKDMFKTDCKIAIVVGRGMTLLQQNPAAIELFWADNEDAVIDPVNKYVMVEAREGYFEASRHMLVAMQKLMTEKFELENHIVHLDRDVKAPRYIEDQPLMDLSSLERNDDSSAAKEHDPDRYINVDVLRDFPNDMDSGMDKSQMSACEKMLTSRVAIVQGPPGTGKTFVSVSALRVMVQNLGVNDPPLIVAAQTNHALDQLLNHVLTFEPNILRLGGRSNKANEAILKRTLFNLRHDNNIPGGSSGFRQAHIQREKCKSDVMATMEPLTTESLLTAETLLKHGLITESQCKSLYGNSDWEGEDASGDIAEWLTEEQLMPVPETTPVNLGLEVEQEYMNEEQVEDIDNEFKADAADEERKLDDDEGLIGDWLPFKRKFTGRHSHPPTLSDKKIKQKLASWKNLFDVPLAHRGEVYRFLEKEMNKIVLKELKARLKDYQDQVNGWSVTKHMSNIRLIRHLGIKVIGCTTTGLSKYRGLLSALQPRVLLIEEAAETLEGNVIGGLMDSIEHLILVGDHQQLQANCTVRALESAPYHLNISMFERLVNNSLGYVMLNTQRRMIQDVRGLLCIDPEPFYKDLHDHPSVLDRVHNRPPVPGMGGLDTYFFHHDWEEATNAECSRYNLQEAQMIARFFLYLCQNGVDARKITVLTFYNDQKFAVIQELNMIEDLKGLRPFNVFTVDSYQGEENDVILLSLVRSNESNLIGFLNSKNRLVVALSRARRGLYLFGNMTTLATAETNEDIVGRDPLWYPLISHMIRQRRANVDGGLPVTCSKHGKTTRIYDHRHFGQVFAGGCDQKCGGTLPCGHSCKITCHPCDHSSVPCNEACVRVLTCGHKCSAKCTAKCYCEACGLYDGQFHVPDYVAEDTNFVDGTGPLDTVWGDSPTKSSMKRSPSKLLAGKHVSFVPAAKNTLGASDARQATPARSTSGPLMGFSGNRISPPKGADPRPSTPYKPRSGSVQSGYSDLSSQTSVVRRSTFGASNFSPINPDAWQNWDAKKADEELAEKRRIEEESAPKIDRSQLVFKETYIPTTLNKSGERIFASSGARRRLVPRSEIEFSSLDTVLANSSVTLVDGDGVQFKKLHRAFDPFPSPTSPTKLSQEVKNMVCGSSKALIAITSDVSNLSMDDTIPSAFGEGIEYAPGNKPSDQALKSKQEHSGGRGRGDKFRGGSSPGRPRIPSTPLNMPGISRRRPDLNDFFGGDDFDNFVGGDSARGFNPPRAPRSFRGGDSSRGASRGAFRGGDSYRRRSAARSSSRSQGHSRGGRRQSEQALPQPTGDLLGLEDDLPGSTFDTSPAAVEDIVDLYGASPPRSRVQRYQSVWGVDPSTPEQTTQSPTPTPQTPTNPDEFGGKLINFD